MKLKICALAFFLFSSASFARISMDLVTTASQTLLPNPFPVYVKDNQVVNHPYSDFAPKLLPTVNTYTKNPGCYVVCYSHEAKGSVYAVGNNVYVHGQVRVPGTYVNRICLPKGYEGVDISSVNAFKKLCSMEIKSCKGVDCWAGGDSGGWFGIQP
jgi:hypothetical protein